MSEPSRIARVGILGGSFNPVHHGHLIMARDALEEIGLDRIILVPCRMPPHKDMNGLADPARRLAMLRHAAAGEPAFEVNDMELRRDGTSYTIDTILDLRASHNNTEWFFIIGSDTLFELHTWHRVDDLLDLCTIVAMARPGFNARGVKPAELKIGTGHARRLLESVISGHRMEISASDIRARVAAGRSIRYLAPEIVAGYIEEHGLYGPPSE